MDLNEYQSKARSTAVYPKPIGLAYVALGLGGELGEVVEKIDKKAEGCEILPELGDMAWYSALLAWELALPLSECKPDSINLEKPVNVMHQDRSIVYLQIGVSKVLECVKKVYRDQNGVVNRESTLKLNDGFRRVLAEIAAVAGNYGYSFKDVAEANVKKLASRAERGKLHGNGDDR